MTRVHLWAVMLPMWILGAAVAHGDVGARAPAPPPAAKQLTLAEQLDAALPAAMAGDGEAHLQWCLSKTGANVSAEPPPGIPRAFYTIVLATSTNDGFKGGIRDLSEHMPEFDHVWTEVEHKQAEVAEAVAAAKQLLAAHKPEDARKLLGDHVSETPVKSDGNLVPRTRPLVVADAELPALYALADVARELHDAQLLFDLGLSLFGRRAVLDKDSERLLWMSHKSGGLHHRYELSGPPVVAGAFGAVETATRDIMSGSLGMGLAHDFLAAWPSYGLYAGVITDPKSVKVGDLGVFALKLEKGGTINIPARDRLTYTYDRVDEIYDHCHNTTEIERVDPSTGDVTYAQECQTHNAHHKASMHVGFGTLLKPTTPHTEPELLVIFGRVKHAGPDWVIDNARSVDARFLFPVVTTTALPAAFNWFQFRQ